jgi:two-component sensor histidine kinase
VGHITSLDPIRPENAPEPWEAAALRSFEEGVEEVTNVTGANGKRVLRLMRPLVTEESCLRCHAQQGYEVGEIRGGISVSVPMDEYLRIARTDFATAMAGYGTVWVFGVAGILYAARSVGRRARHQIQAQERIQDLLSARELMLREVHHRVKNNMGMMSSLLDLKAMSVQDAGAADALTDVADRFGVMSTLYDTLYRSPSLDGLSTSQFLSNVVDDLAASVPRADAVVLQADVEDVELSVDTLSALGILVAEAVTNALKYAFPNGSGGTVEVRGRLAGTRMELTVQDDGVGLPPDVEFDSGSGLGLRLIGSLAEQIGGRAEIVRDGGTGIRVVFPVHAHDIEGTSAASVS